MYKALVSFSGLISMAEGEIKEITNKDIIKDLLNAGFIEEINISEKVEKKARKKSPKGE